jgi:hypothetical protein
MEVSASRRCGVRTSDREQSNEASTLEFRINAEINVMPRLFAALALARGRKPSSISATGPMWYAIVQNLKTLALRTLGPPPTRRRASFA